MDMKHVLLSGLLLWYVAFFFFMGSNPVDPHSWGLANILPVLFVGFLASTYQRLSFSSASYVLMTFFLTLHTIGSHYTYEQVPFGIWLEEILELPRNHFDRLVHFCFGLLFAYPLYELFGKIEGLSAWLRSYMVLMTLVGLGGLWEILESWVARMVRPELGPAFLGAQGDLWDAQKDMAATLYGVLIGLAIMIVARKFIRPHAVVSTERMLELPHAPHHCDYR
jgi:putative membrane protein